VSDGSLFWVKIGFALLVLAVGLVGASLPWLLGRRTSSDRTLALGDTFAGGVLGGAGLIHLLDDGMTGFRSALPQVDYPLALLLAGGGFLLILLLEGVVVGGGHGHADVPAHAHTAATQHEIAWADGAARPVPYPVVLLMVLSVHSVILGLALGAQSSLAGTVPIVLAIVAHKGLAGFSLGVGYRRGGLAWRRAAPEIGFFAVMTPLGILIGSAVGAILASGGGRVFETTFDSIGAGTFVYIAALDIIKTEFDSPADHAAKWLAACLGFGLMALLALWL
jgi:zinc transporter 1/2/3